MPLLLIHHLIDPHAPDLPARRSLIWAVLLTDPKSFRTEFKFQNRWIEAYARPNGSLTFFFRSNHQPTPADWEPAILRFLTQEVEM